MLPIPIPTAVAIYFVVWWIVLFAVLPWGVRSQQEANDIAPGTEPGAPAAPHLIVKALVTTGVSAVVLVFILALYAYE